MQLLASFLTGVLLGAVFRLLGLPVPAPEALAGVVAIGGIWAGAALVNLFK